MIAALDMVAEAGVRGATVRGIAERANVTQGLIRHYFNTKEELIHAAYEYHMNHLTDQATARSATGSAQDRLSDFVQASLRPPILDPRSIALWSGFLNKVQQDPDIRRIHAATYVYFRDRLESLIAEALDEAGQTTSPDALRRLAIACNAVIDGLWLEGGALPDAFGEDELAGIGRDAVAALIGLPLP